MFKTQTGYDGLVLTISDGNDHIDAGNRKERKRERKDSKNRLENMISGVHFLTIKCVMCDRNQLKRNTLIWLPALCVFQSVSTFVFVCLYK